MPEQFGAFTASELYCPKCGRSQPVRERLLLVLPSGELHEFLCSRCSTSLGKRTVTGPAVVPAANVGQASRLAPARKQRQTGRTPYSGPGQPARSASPRRLLRP